MTEKYIPYKLDGETYNIPESLSSTFEQDYPSASIEMHIDNDVYDIPLEQKAAVLNDYPNAVYTFGESIEETSDDDNKPSWGESLVKGAGAGFTRAGKGIYDTLVQLSSGMLYNDPETGEAKKTKDYDVLMKDESDPIRNASVQAGELAERLSKEADPTNGEKGFVDLIKEGKIGTALQKGLAVGAESLPMTLSAANPYTMALNAISMAGANYAEQTLENPEVDKVKRAAMAIGSAALEQAIEKFADPVFKYIGGGKGAGQITEWAAKELLEKSTKEGAEEIAKRILGMLKNTGKEALGEGVEEIASSAGNDLLGGALDLISGDKDYGIQAQWNEYKEANPDATKKDFALAKGKEYMDSFIGGALSGAYMTGTVQTANEGAKAIGDKIDRSRMQESYNIGASKDVPDMYDVNSDVNDVIESASSVFLGENGESSYSNSFFNELTAEQAFELSRREEFSPEQRRALNNLANAKAVQEGLNQKLDNRINDAVSQHRSLIETVADNGIVVTGVYNGAPVYVEGGVVENGVLKAAEGVSGPLIVVNAMTGERDVANSSDIASVESANAEEYVGGIEQMLRTNDLHNREVFLNTMSPRAKFKAIQPYAGKKILIDTENGPTEVYVQNISNNGEVTIKGKKGDLGGQSILTMNSSVFYDSIHRDDTGNPIITEAPHEEEVNVTEQPEPINDVDYRGESVTLLLNDVPTQVDVISQDNTSDTIVYEFIDENGNTRQRSSTIGEFQSLVQKPVENQSEMESDTVSDEQPDNVPTEADVPSGEVSEIELKPDEINWDELFERDTEAYFAELQKQFGESTIDILNNEIEAAIEEMESLEKKKGSTMNERILNLSKRANLKIKIGVLNELVERLNTPTEEPVSEANVVSEETEQPSEQPVEEPVNESPVADTTPEPTDDTEPVAESISEDEPVSNEQKKSTAPNPVADPVKEAQKKEAELLYQLGRAGISEATKQDLARRAGKAIGDMFATRQEYEAYEETANDLGEFLVFFEGGVEESFAKRNITDGGYEENLVSLSEESNKDNNGEQSEGRPSDTDSGRTSDEGNSQGDSGDTQTESSSKGKSKGGKTRKQVEKYPARKGNATQKLLIDTFGFNSVTIPNSRKSTLNSIYDFMIEMSKMLGISPKSIGQGGWLSISNLRSNNHFAAVHEVQSYKVSGKIVNVSLKFKYSILTGIAHEWFHSLDYALEYFDTGVRTTTASEIKKRDFHGREEVWNALDEIVKAINASGHPERIKKLVRNISSWSYWLSPKEMCARAFDEYIRIKFKDAGIEIEGVNNDIDTGNPTPEEMVNIIPAFDNLFKVLHEKEGKKPDTSILYHIGEMMDNESNVTPVVNNALDIALDENTGINVYRLSDEETKQELELIGADPDTHFSVDTDKPIFLSNAAIAVSNIKQEKATPEQWLKMIEKNGGLKAGEDKWMGLSDWLKAQDAKTLTKQEVLDFINENTIKIEEVNYRHWDDLDYIDEATKILEAEMKEIGWDAMVEKYPNFDYLFEEYDGELLWSETRASVAEYEQFIFDDNNILDRPINETRERYTSDGVLNKKEIAIIVPTIESWNKSDVIHFGDAGDGRAVAWVRFGDSEFIEETDESKEAAEALRELAKDAKEKYGDKRSAWPDDVRAAYDLLLEQEISSMKLRKILFIDEIQSKRHQDAREHGGYRVSNVDSWLADNGVEIKESGEFYEFYKNGELDRRFSKGLLRYDIESAKNLYVSGYVKSSIPEAPFERNWSELAMKRMLRYAAENGYDAVAWTKGEQQADRYDLGNRISAIHYRQFADEMRIAIIISNVGTERFGVDKNGVVVSSDSQFVTKGMNISEIFEKEIANKIINNEGEADEHGGKRISGDGLRIGAEGMKGFYDKMLPAFMDKYGKKWGVKVADIELPLVEADSGYLFHSVPVTESMRESVMEGQPMFYKTPNGIVYGWAKGNNIYLTKAGLNPNTKIHEYTHLWADAMMHNNPEGWESIKNLLKNTPVWNEVMNDVNYSSIHNNEDAVASEALSRISGADNAIKMEQMAQKLEADANGTMRKLEARGLIQNMKDALSKFWNWVGTELFGIKKFDSIEQITDRVLYDLLNKTDLGPLDTDSNKFSKQRRQRYVTIPSSEYAVLSESLHSRFGEKNVFGCIGYTSNYFYLCDYFEGETKVRAIFEIEADDETREYIENYARRGDGFTAESFIAGIDSAGSRISRTYGYFDGFENEEASVGDGSLDTKQSREDAESGRDNEPVSNNRWYTIKSGYNGSQFARIRFVDESELDFTDSDNIVFSIDSSTGIDPTDIASASARETYERVVNNGWQEFQRQFQDAFQPVRIAIEAIQQETGNIPIEDYENYLLIQNQSSSRSRVEIDNFARRYYSPIIEQINSIIDKIILSTGLDTKNKEHRASVYNELKKYLIAKHGLERNEYYQTHNTRKLTAYEQKKENDIAKKDYDDKVDAINNDATLTDAERQLQLRDALDEYNAILTDIKTREVPDLRDYSGLTTLFGFKPKNFREAEDDARQFVNDFEVRLGRVNDAAGEIVSQSADIDALWKKINAATDKTLKHSYESGLLSRQQYNDIKSMFSFYIPLRGFDETTAEDVYSYARFEGNRFNPAVQTAKGRTSIADDPIAIIMNMAESEIAQGNKNRAKQALYSYLLNRIGDNNSQNSLMQIEEVWYVKTVDSTGNEVYVIATPNYSTGETYEEFENRMKALEATDDAYKSKRGNKVDVGMRFQKQMNRNSHYVYLKVNGVEKAIYINGDPKAADAINGTQAQPLSEGVQLFRDIQRNISSTFTNYSLEFTARNYFRDMLYSHINIGVRESDPAYRKKFRQNWRRNNMGTMLKMLKAYRAGEFDGRQLNEDEAAFVSFMENGGQTGYTLIHSVEAHKRDLQKAIERMQKGIEKGGVKDSAIFKATLGGIELLNEASELITRFAAYKTSVDMGRGINRAINDAKEVTVNFNTRGAQDGKGWMGALARYFGWSKYFFNASVQGVQNIKAMADANRLKFCTTVGGVIATGFMMPIIIGMIAEILGGDDDDENAYWNIPEYDRQNNLCIPVGNGLYAKIPLPIGFREVYAIGDMVAAMAFDKKFTRDASQVGMDIANKISSVLLPINPLESSVNGLNFWHTFLYTTLPSTAQFAIQNATNVDWKGAPLQKEYTYNEDDPSWMKAYASNPDWMTGLSKWCNEHINLDGDYKGLDWSPEKLDNTLSNLFGGIYSVVKKSGNAISMVWNEENRDLYNVPLAGVVIGSGIGSDEDFITDSYYDMKEYYDSNLGYIKRRAENFGYDLDDVFLKQKGAHHPKMQEIYSNDNFDFMQEWYKGNNELDKLNDKIKNIEKKIAEKEKPSQSLIEKLAREKVKFEAERREFVNDMLELD